jgi:uncharacterized protein (TIGR03086 family)
MRETGMTTNLATTWRILDEAHAALRSAVAGVPAGAGDDPTPCEGWTVTQVLQHAAGDQQGFAAVLTGGPFPDENPFAPSGVLAGPMAALLEPALAAARRAWSTVDPADAAVPTPLPQGALPPAVAVGACALDAAVHAWDIAVATGQPSPLTAPLARTLLGVARAIVEPLRAFGAYAPALADEAGDDDVAALLRYLGRRPGWTV